jgi:hypothetical protein
MAGLICHKADQPTRLVFRMLVYRGRKGEKKGFRERDFASLLDAAHQQLGGNIVLVWDNYSHHVDAAIRDLIGKTAVADGLPLPDLKTDAVASSFPSAVRSTIPRDALACKTTSGGRRPRGGNTESQNLDDVTRP